MKQFCPQPCPCELGMPFPVCKNMESHCPEVGEGEAVAEQGKCAQAQSAQSCWGPSWSEFLQSHTPFVR